jgi:hypothetical protein
LCPREAIAPEQVRSNTESTRRQYALADRAVEMGWSTGQVRVIDEDQGQSGSLPNSRPGFLELVAAVVRGEVGIVMGLEVSRPETARTGAISSTCVAGRARSSRKEVATVTCGLHQYEGGHVNVRGGGGAGVPDGQKTGSG